jgi:predicted nucleotidyltransferase/protein tyrosine/serine phosphatase
MQNMQHEKTHKIMIEKLKEVFKETNGIDSAILYGSLARNEATPNSDIDIKILKNSHFNKNQFCDNLKNCFTNEITAIREVELRNKIVIYFKFLPKVEFSICTNISEIDNHYSHSMITDYKSSILFKNETWDFDLNSYLLNLTALDTSKNNDQLIKDQIDKFIYEFENCSSFHRRSDGYKFYFFYNVALHSAIQIYYLSLGNKSFYYLPKYVSSGIIKAEDMTDFYKLNGTLFLPDANEKKRNLLDFFYKAVAQTKFEKDLEEIKAFCESFYVRDFFWNFRDIGLYNNLIKKGMIYRTATLTVFQNENRLVELLKDIKITCIIDLRADREIEEKPYSDEILSGIKYVKAQFDPWNQPDWFKKEFNFGTNEEIAYRFFILGCKEKIKLAIEAILESKTDAVAIHCFAGKDRTGIFISLLHLLSGADYETIFWDYLASEVDVKEYRLRFVLEIIEKEGGIENYLKSCGLSTNQITKLKNKLINGN